MSITAIPVLGPEGFLTDPHEKLKVALAHAYASDFSQSEAFAGKVASVSHVVAEFMEDSLHLGHELERMLTAYLTTLYPTNVEVEVTDVSKDPNSTTVAMNIFVEVTDHNGKVINLSQALRLDPSALNKIVSVINAG